MRQQGSGRRAGALAAGFGAAALLVGCAAGELSEGFEPFANGPVLVITQPSDGAPEETPSDGAAAVMRSLEAALERDAAAQSGGLPSDAATPAPNRAASARAPQRAAAAAAPATGETGPRLILLGDEPAAAEEASREDVGAAGASHAARSEPALTGAALALADEKRARAAALETTGRRDPPRAPQSSDPVQTTSSPATATALQAEAPEWRETALGRCVSRMPRPLPTPDCAAASGADAASCPARRAQAERFNAVLRTLAPERCASREDLAAAQAALRWLGAPRLEITGALDQPTLAALTQFAETDPSLSLGPTRGFFGAVLRAGAERQLAAQRQAAQAAPQDPWRRFLDEPDPRVAFLLPEGEAGLQLHCVRRGADRLRVFFFSKTPAPAAALLRLSDDAGAAAAAPLSDLGDQGAPGRPLFAMATAESDAGAAQRMAEFLLEARGEITLELADPAAPGAARFLQSAFPAGPANGAAADLLAVCRI